jgi:hypothetical protein
VVLVPGHRGGRTVVFCGDLVEESGRGTLPELRRESRYGPRHPEPGNTMWGCAADNTGPT